MRHALLFLSSCLVALGIIGCGGGTSTGTDSGLDAATLDAATLDAGGEDATTPLDAAPDAVTPDAASADAGADTGTSDVVMCGAGTTVFPTFDRSCSVAADCAMVLHQVDCCGSLVVTGIHADEQARFDAAETSCRAMYPRCRCAAQPTRADDDSTGDMPFVDCVAGVCSTSHR